MLGKPCTVRKCESSGSRTLALLHPLSDRFFVNISMPFCIMGNDRSGNEVRLMDDDHITMGVLLHDRMMMQPWRGHVPSADLRAIMNEALVHAARLDVHRWFNDLCEVGRPSRPMRNGPRRIGSLGLR